LRVPWREDFNALVYVLAGRGTVGAAGATVRRGQLAVFGPGSAITIRADESQDGPSATLEVLLLGGAPIGVPVAWHGPFVMNTRAEIVQALEDYQAGRLGRVPAGHLDR
jgi:redox-sensitive bicupin YhaK (pirin superfamily)